MGGSKSKDQVEVIQKAEAAVTKSGFGTPKYMQNQ